MTALAGCCSRTVGYQGSMLLVTGTSSEHGRMCSSVFMFFLGPRRAPAEFLCTTFAFVPLGSCRFSGLCCVVVLFCGLQAVN